MKRQNAKPDDRKQVVSC